MPRPIEKCRLLEQVDSQEALGGKTRSLDDRTRNDLDMDHVFRSLDHSTSSPGAQFLYQTLVTPGFGAEASRIPESLVAKFESDADLREKAQLELLPLDDETSYSLPKLIWENLHRPPLSKTVVRLCALSLPLFVLAAFFEPLFWAGALGMFFVNLLVHYKYESAFGYEINVLASLGKLVRTSANLHEMLGRHLPPGTISETALEASIQKCLPLARDCAYVQLRDPTQLLDYLNILTLRKVLAYNSLREKIETRQNHLRALFRTVGLIDTGLSIASYRAGLTVWCKPEFTDLPGVIQADDLRHPGIERAVGYSLALEGESMLITGTNMSGKTTFLKAVALNAILAQTIHTAVARKYKACRFHCKTSIDAADDLVSGRSLFAAEVDAVQELIAYSQQHQNCLFIIDELFRGTNPAERVAAAAAVIQHLAEDNLVITATHDLAMAGLLDHKFAKLHFSESYEDGEAEPVNPPGSARAHWETAPPPRRVSGRRSKRA